MKKLIVLVIFSLLCGCAAKKEDKTNQPVIHTGHCDNSGKKINCSWNDVNIEEDNSSK